LSKGRGKISQQRRRIREKKQGKSRKIFGEVRRKKKTEKGKRDMIA